MITLVELERQVRQIIENEFPTLAKFTTLTPDEKFRHLHIRCRNIGFGVYCLQKEFEIVRSFLAILLADYNKYFSEGIPSCHKCKGEIAKYPYARSVIPMVDHRSAYGCTCPIKYSVLAETLAIIERSHAAKMSAVEAMRILPLPIAGEIAWHIVD